MSRKSYKVFPRTGPCAKDAPLRSKEFTVCPGEYALISGYDMCGICVKVYQVHQTECSCEYSQRPYCVNGTQVGLGEDCPTAMIPMPGCYVLEVCEDEDASIEDACVYLEINKQLENPQLLLAGASHG